ncbi:hypothetical protein Syun_007241 [Stephania yunnanensis]|uniref:Uncharacterized protein n=1 Tax=Stephania yunnanensis TaxID=152371 RepID=A0AAP0PZ77_9MAGN
MAPPFSPKLYFVIPLPPLFNLPKSQLQCYGESVYCTSVGEDVLSKCNKGETQIERLLAVVTWSISTLRPLKFGVAPYNPVLGETHHVSRGSLNVIIEQVVVYEGKIKEKPSSKEEARQFIKGLCHGSTTGTPAKEEDTLSRVLKTNYVFASSRVIGSARSYAGTKKEIGTWNGVEAFPACRLPPNASYERKYVTDVSLTSTRYRDHRLAERYLTRNLKYDQHRSNNRIIINERAEKGSHRPFDHTQTHVGIE